MIYSFVAVILIASIYSYFQENIDEANREMEILFINGGTLICKNNEVKRENFNYERGTSSFMSKPTYKRALIIYDIKDCNPKDSNTTKR
jgi:hypothetical protein